MGKMILAWESFDKSFYFPRIRQRSPEGRYITTPDMLATYETYYPHPVYIDNDFINSENPSCYELRKKVRRFIEHNVENEAFIAKEDLTQKYTFKRDDRAFTYDSDWHRMTHGYWIIFFEHASEAVLFKLTFNEYVSDRILVKPGYEEVIPNPIDPRDQRGILKPLPTSSDD